MQMTHRQIEKAFTGVNRFDLIECARIRLLGRVYPRGSRGREAWHVLVQRNRPRAGYRAWCAAYQLARASLEPWELRRIA